MHCILCDGVPESQHYWCLSRGRTLTWAQWCCSIGYGQQCFKQNLSSYRKKVDVLNDGLARPWHTLPRWGNTLKRIRRTGCSFTDVNQPIRAQRSGTWTLRTDAVWGNGATSRINCQAKFPTTSITRNHRKGKREVFCRQKNLSRQPRPWLRDNCRKSLNRRGKLAASNDRNFQRSGLH